MSQNTCSRGNALVRDPQRQEQEQGVAFTSLLPFLQSQGTCAFPQSPGALKHDSAQVGAEAGVVAEEDLRKFRMGARQCTWTLKGKLQVLRIGSLRGLSFLFPQRVVALGHGRF